MLVEGPGTYHMYAIGDPKPPPLKNFGVKFFRYCNFLSASISHLFLNILQVFLHRFIEPTGAYKSPKLCLISTSGLGVSPQNRKLFDLRFLEIFLYFVFMLCLLTDMSS